MKLTDEQILEMAEERMDYDDNWRFAPGDSQVVSFARAIEATCQTKWLPMEIIPERKFVDVLLGSHANPDYKMRLTDVCKTPDHSCGWTGIKHKYLNSDIYYFIGWMPLPEAE